MENKIYEVPEVEITVFENRDLLDLSLGGKSGENPGEGDPISVDW